MKYSEKAYINRMAITCHTIVDAVLFVAYLLEWVKGSRTLGYFLLMAAFFVIPVVIEWIIYRRNPDSMVVRHIMGFTYSAMYILAIFTTNSILTFTYAIPMFVAITIFSDVLYCSLICVGGFLSNVAYVIYHAINVGYSSQELPDVEIRIACMALVGSFMVLMAIANKRIGKERLKNMEEQQDKTQALLEKTLEASGSMSVDIATVTEKMGFLGDSVSRIQEAMKEVSGGTNETAESIQNQLGQTENIQNQIAKVKDSTEVIERNMTDTASTVAESKQQMADLAAQVAKSMDANSQVLAKMEELNEYTRQMNTIIETITSIANSTGMLALNASIEAARAGEAGRGFAVVAGEISTLANQTKTAMVDITNLIGNINNELINVSQAVDVVTQSNQENVERTRQVSESFVAIAEGADKVNSQAAELIHIVAELEKANGDIVEKIQTISAITEEVSAHTSETYNNCEENSRMVEEINTIVTHLNEGAEKLKNM